MSYFNLLDEPWIPVRLLDGGRDEVGIRDALTRAAEYRGIEHPSPLVVASLHRLLLALLYRAVDGPTDMDQALALFTSGLPKSRIVEYLDRWAERFWLFHDHYPFYQIPKYEPKVQKGGQQWKPWLVLAAERNGDNSKVMFDHVDGARAGSINSGEAARLLVACQAFALGGGNSDLGYTTTAPSASEVMAIPMGKNLQETLLYCLVPQNRAVHAGDVPVWEREPETLATLREAAGRAGGGYADLYTWRSRSVKLRLEGRGTTVSELAFASGVPYKPSEELVDPMVAYRIDKNHGKLPVRFSERGFWREFDSILPDSVGLAPRVIEHAAAVGRAVADGRPRLVVVLGQANDKAKVEYWRMERFAFPEAVSSSRPVRDEVRALLDEAGAAAKQLWTAESTFARHMLARGNREPHRKDITAFIGSSSATAWYWSSLEPCFHGVLGDLLDGRDSTEIWAAWLSNVRNNLGAAWGAFRASVPTEDSWSIRGLVLAEGPVLRTLKKLDERIGKRLWTAEGE